MKSKPISLNLVIFVMFISRSISTLVNQEDSPTLSFKISTKPKQHVMVLTKLNFMENYFMLILLPVTEKPLVK